MSALNKTETESSDKKFQINKTGLIYDPLMLNFYCLWDKIYPEKPDRIKKPYERCQFYQLTDKCVSIPGRMCTDDEIELCHTKRVNEMMKSCESMTTEELMDLSTKYDSMYFHQKSDEAARFALGSSINLLDNIMTEKVQNGFAIIRPPGHHAMHDEPNGYCYFNNAAVVARTALEKYGLKRILIVDWDVHHGQGVQYAFYNDPRVLYISLHRYDYGEFWPNLRQGDFDYIGDKEGKGFNINIPLNKTGFGNSEYLAAFQSLILPIAYEFNPELVIISCGFDAAIGCFEFNPELVLVDCGFDSALGDEKGKMMVTPACYAHFVNALSTLSNGKLCVLLEGGYCIKSLSEGVALTVRALLGYPTPRIETTTQPNEIFVRTILNLISILRPYWNCLKGLNEECEIPLKDYLEQWDAEHRTGVKFYCDNPPPEKFDLTGFYPLYPEEENIRLDKEIDKLIEITDLFIPVNKTCVGLTQNETSLVNHFSKTKLIASQNESLLLDVVNEVCSRKSTNGLVVLRETNLFEKINSAATHSLQSYERVKRVLMINLFSGNELHHLNEDRVLSINIISASEATNSNGINLKLKQLNDTGLITLFSRVVMPIAYQFNPDLVFVNLNETNADLPVSVECLGHAMRWLSSLANSNNILSLNMLNGSAKLNDLLFESYKVYSNDNCSHLPSLVPNLDLQTEIRELIESLHSNWSCFQFNDKLPKY